jgi:hypothetical protein
VHEHILGLEVSMDYIVLVQVLDCRTNLFDDILDCSLGQAVLVGLYLGIKIQFEAGFEQKVDTGGVNVEVIELDDARMIQKQLYLDLINGLLQILLSFFPRDHLYRKDEARQGVLD